MSFLRQHLQEIARTVQKGIPKRIIFINSSIINRYQCFQEAASDFINKAEAEGEKNFPQEERFPLIKKIFSLLTMPVSAGTAYRKDHSNELLPIITPSGAEPHEKAEDASTGDVQEPVIKPSRYNPAERIIIEYEDRLRNYAAPEKVFRYFATYCLVSDKGSEIVMTPNDFLRSINPSKKQDRSLGLNRIQRVNRHDIDKLQLNLKINSVFHKLGLNGLITYPDYLFFMTLLTTPDKHFEIAFKMFDESGELVLSAREFEGVAILTRQSATFGTSGQDLHRKSVSLELMRYFFGPHLKDKLSIEDFLDFQTAFKEEILTLEFESKPRNLKGLVSESDFADLLIGYSGCNLKKREEKLKRVQKHFYKKEKGLSRRDYLDFWKLIDNLHDVEMALSFYNLAGASVDRQTFHHIAKSIIDVKLSDHVVNVAFVIFDENSDEELNSSEIDDIVKSRFYRGMECRRGTNFKQILTGLKRCAIERRSYDF